MAYFCPSGINVTDAVLNKVLITQATNVLKDAVLIRTITESCGVAIQSPIMTKTVFEPIMPSVASSSNRPATGQFWPRNVIVRS